MLVPKIVSAKIYRASVAWTSIFRLLTLVDQVRNVRILKSQKIIEKKKQDFNSLTELLPENSPSKQKKEKKKNRVLLKIAMKLI